MKKIDPIKLARYLAFRYMSEGDTITNLKLQKVLYFVYVWTLVKGKGVFSEKFQAWANGPVVPSVYNALKKYGASPIDAKFVNLKSEVEFKTLVNELGETVIKYADKTYEIYGIKSAFELVNLTHIDPAWKKARKGLDVGQVGRVEILDTDVVYHYGKKES